MLIINVVLKSSLSASTLRSSGNLAQQVRLQYELALLVLLARLICLVILPAYSLATLLA